MKRIDPLNGLLLFLMILVFASCHKDQVVPKKGIDLVLNATEQHQATADNAFTFNLFKTVRSASTGGQNLFISPLSVSFALGMTSNGAKGATLDAMKKALNFSSFTGRDEQLLQQANYRFAPARSADHAEDRQFNMVPPGI